MLRIVDRGTNEVPESYVTVSGRMVDCCCLCLNLTRRKMVVVSKSSSVWRWADIDDCLLFRRKCTEYAVRHETTKH